MNHHPSRRRCEVGILALATTLSVILLTACSSKPPGCADEQTVNMAKSILLERWKGISASYVRNFNMSSEAANQYNQALKLDIREIVSNGYDESARRHVCKGVFALSTPTGMSFTSSRAFSSQATEEGGGKFIVEVENVDSIATLGADFSGYVTSQKK